MIHNILKPLLLLSGLISLNSAFVSAQDTTALKKIKGVITNSDNSKEPIIGANIMAINGNINTSTDENGYFEMEVPLTTSKIAISYVGYINDTLSLSNLLDQQINIKLKPSLQLNEVTISRRKKSTEISTLSTMKVEKISTKELMKAACCNLSESFETTPSVDVGFTDAVSGYKQIQMLGLAGSYTSFTRENIPDIRGLAAITGLTFTPGAWVESMQLSKGAGSVVNGYEGTTGQINIEWRKPFEENEPKLYLNGYQSTQGRSEANAILSHKFSEQLSSNLLLHGRGDWLKVDNNNDGFLDQPLGTTFVGANRWFYFNPSGLEIQGGIKGVYLKNTGGQKDYERGIPQVVGNPWGYQQDVNRIEGWAKIGKVFPHKEWKSMGLQLSGVYHDQKSLYSIRKYNASQQSFYANYIYQSIINNTNHIIKAGASFSADNIKETFITTPYQRQEYVTGAFAEYSYKYLTKFNIVAGLRADYHNLFGLFFTPRLHVRYAPTENTAIRASIGRAQRTANVFAENLGYLASNRIVLLPFNDQKKPYGFDPEVAWNMGVNFTQKFMLNYRDGAFSTDYYYTHFTNQVVVDIENPSTVRFYNLDGQSYAHSFQAQLDYELIRKLDIRLAYRFYDVKSTYDGVLKSKPLVAAHRAFVNLGYETKNNWKFDYTFQWYGTKRLPDRWAHHGNNIVASSESPTFIQMNAQISKGWKDGNVEVYAGVENITNYMQHDMILGGSNPYGNTFDGSLIWGPGMGRNIYFGFRYKLK
jgi:outer membrane receptor for ferrienterochelin and colicins